MMIDFLRKISFFSGLADRDLKSLLKLSGEINLKSGEVLFEEGDPGDLAYVIIEGRIEIGKLSDGMNVLLALREEGELIGEMSLLEDVPRMAGARASGNCRLLSISREQLEDLLISNPNSAMSMLRTVTGRLRETESMLKQKEKMAHLGTLSAGMAHELNNPASAVQRGSVQLASALTRVLEIPFAINQLILNPDQMKKLQYLLGNMENFAGKLEPLSSLERSDRELLVEEWLEERGISDVSVHAPELVSMGYRVSDLHELELLFPGPILENVINLVCGAFVAYKVLNEITQGSSQIASIVRAMKSYVYLDEAPVQEVNIHEGIENTLIILKHKLKQGITVHRDFDSDLPPVFAFGSELNQVWTNLIDNAADVLEGSGDITIRTATDDLWVMVEVEDNGPGIPEEYKPRIFDLFFTTKPMGLGSGQGMHITYNIVRRHGGSIDIRSRPGKTVFRVCIPTNFQENSSALPLLKGEQTDYASS